MRLIVFMDWQNVYKRAREAFGFLDDDFFTQGQVWPHKVAQEVRDLVATREGLQASEVDVVSIRVYRGSPKNNEDPKAYAAFRKQTQAWRNNNNRVHVTHRDLVYRQLSTRDGSGSTVRTVSEKGIDVQLAVDLVTLCTEDEYDYAVVFSSDNDLAPAVEYVMRKGEPSGLPQVAVASWQGGTRMNARTPERHVWCFYLDRERYLRASDDRDYTIPTQKSPAHAPVPGPR